MPKGEQNMAGRRVIVGKWRYSKRVWLFLDEYGELHRVRGVFNATISVLANIVIARRVVDEDSKKRPRVQELDWC